MGISKEQLKQALTKAKEYTDNNGAIKSISVNGEATDIDENKNIDIDLSGYSTEVELTMEEYEALSDEEKNNGTTYYITDGEDEYDNIQADFLTSSGFGKLRYYNGKFQYFNKTTGTWTDIEISSDNSLVMNLAPQAMQKMHLTYDIDNDAYKITFKEPKDTIVDGQMLVCVEGIKFVRKLGSEPTDENDGTLVLDYKRRDFSNYNHTSYLDKDFDANTGENWYYKAFPYSTNGIIANSSANVASCVCKDYYLYGFKLDQNESDPASMITYLENCDNAYYESAYMDYDADLFNYGDWEDAWFIRDLKPCMLNYDGTVAYELNRNNYSFKANGLASDIANETFEGNAMIGFPKVYWKIIDNGDDTANIYFCNKKIDDDFVCWAHIDNNGNEIDYCYMPIYSGYCDGTRLRSLSGKEPMHSQTTDVEIAYAKANNQTSNVIWYTEVFSDRQLVNLLLLLIGKSTDTQTVFGNGYCTNDTQNTNLCNTGTMDSKGLFWGSNTFNIDGVKVFGVEHWWGNQWRRIAGWVVDNGTQKIKLTYGQSDNSTVNGYNLDGDGYIVLDNCTPTGINRNYINKMTVVKHMLIPTVSEGTATTYYPDGLFFNNSALVYALVGGSTINGLMVGALALTTLNTYSVAQQNFGVSISCKPLATT